MKMKLRINISLFLVWIVLLAGCSNLPVVQTQTASPEPSGMPQVTLPPAISPEPTGTPMPTYPPTIEPTQRVEMVRDFLRTNGNCERPCFWGIISGETSRRDAVELLNSLLSPGTEIEQGGGQHKYMKEYEMDGDSFSITAKFYEDEISYFSVEYSNIERGEDIAENWTSLFPNQVLQSYGKPDDIHFIFYDDMGHLLYGMTYQYGDSSIITYTYRFNNIPSAPVCFNDLGNMVYFNLYLGDDLENSRGTDYPVSVQDATGLTLDKFYEEMIASPEGVCFQVPPGLIEAGEE